MRPAFVVSFRLREFVHLGAACAVGFGVAWWLRSGDETGAGGEARSPAVPNVAAGGGPLSVAESRRLPAPGSPAFQAILAAETGPAARLRMIRGLFAHLATTLPPAEAIGRALQFSGEEQETALLELAARWTGVEAEKLRSARGFSAALEAGLTLIQSDHAPADAAEAWVRAFRDHPARVELTIALADRLAGTDPERAIMLAEGFTGWEQRRFEFAFIASRARFDPEAARAFMNRPGNTAGAEAREQFWQMASVHHPEWAEKAFAAEGDSATRMEAVRGFAKLQADSGTLEALAWADKLTVPAEREAAHETIYEATPRGIGAILASHDGFPLIRGILPDSAAAQAGLRQGDRMVEVTGPDGTAVSLYQQPLDFAVQRLRGEAGESLMLRILRDGPDGRPQEETVRIARSQLIFPPRDRAIQ